MIVTDLKFGNPLHSNRQCRDLLGQRCKLPYSDVWVALLATILLVCEPSLAFDVHSKTTVPVNKVRGEAFEKSLALYSGKFLRSEVLAQSVLRSHAAKSSVTGLRESSSAELTNGTRVIKYAHQFQGLPIANDWVMLVLSKHNTVEHVRYHLSQPDATVANVDRYWQLSSSEALNRVSDGDKYHFQTDTLSRTWFEVDQELLPAYAVSADKFDFGVPALFKLVVSAIDGSVLAVYPLSHDMNAYTYRVYADAEPELPFQNPYGDTSPHPTNTPGGAPPASFVSQTDFTISELSSTSNDPWLADDATETVGNNVDVFFNFTRGTDGVFDFFGDGYGPQYRVRGDAFDQDFRAPITSDELLFTYEPSDYLSDYHQPLQSASDPTPDQVKAINAKTVQAFYMANLMRDLFYDAGFTEAAGNAQSSNFARGGVENDPLIVHINSFTFVSTPEDGVSPVIHLGRSRGGDTSFDTTVFAHEWAHYMFRRLVNPVSPLLDNQARAINEGWADVVGLLMSLKPMQLENDTSKGFSSSYAMGSYFTQDRTSATFPDPFFYGIRRYPYGQMNPFLFRHIAHKEPLPAGFTYSDYIFRGTQNSQIHTAGEIWANTVWDCFQNILLSRIGNSFASKRDLLASYVVGGMASTPPNPTYLEARNGLLAAIKSSSSADYASCRSSFASKGMGSAAVSPPRTSKTFARVVESFANDDLHLSIIGSALNDDRAPLDQDGILDQSESGELLLTLRNTGFERIDQATLVLGTPTTDYQRLGARNVVVTNISPGQTVQVGLPLKLKHQRHFDLTEFPIEVTAVGANPSWTRNYSLSVKHRTHYDIRTQATAGPVGEEFGVTLQDWRLDRLETQSFVDSKWEEKVIANNVVFEIQEPVLGQEGGVLRAWESPWMRRGSGELTIRFKHAFQLPTLSALVEISENGTDWLPFTVTEENYTGDSAGFPFLIAEELANTTVIEGADFKVRFRTIGRPPMVWRLDDFEISGVVEQPFKEILVEDGKDTVSICIPIKTQFKLAVICL